VLSTFVVPVTGFAATIPSTASNRNVYVMTPAGTIASGTLTMPAGAVQGQTVNVSSHQKVTALTLSPNTGQTILDAVTTLAAAASAEYIMDGASTWHRIG
jgi:hypothetical protein